MAHELWHNRRAVRINLRLAATAVCAVIPLLLAAPARARPGCETAVGAVAAVHAPGARLAWRAEIVGDTPLHSAPGSRSAGAVGPRDASWVLVLGVAHDPAGRCWLHVRLPSRPNDASAWINAGRVVVARTPWRIAIWRSARRLVLYRDGRRVLRFRVVVGAPETPTPTGLFSIVGAWRNDPTSFDGAYILGTTAHSDVLRRFEGGDGRVGVHGRGGDSLRDPLGTARSHGCVRLSNTAISSIVHLVGANRIPGIPVRVR